MLNFKTEVFSILANVSWTYLLHEFYDRKRIKIVDSDGRSLLLSQMITRSDCPLSKGARKNLDDIKTIRDEVEHKMLGKSDSNWLPLFQACCLNFDNFLCHNFSESLSLQKELSIALQFSRLNVDQISTLQKYHIPGHIEALDARLKEGMTDEEISDLDYQFRVVYTLDSASKSRSHFEFVSPGSGEGKEIRNIMQKFKIADELYPFKPLQIVTPVSQRSGKPFTGHNHNQAWRKFNVRPRNGFAKPEQTNKDYCIYHLAHKDYTHSEKWVDFLVNQIATDEGYAAILAFNIQ